MELAIFARFRALEGSEAGVEAAIREVLPRSPALLDPFALGRRGGVEHHADLPHTVRFLERVQPLIDHPLDVGRAQRLDV